jgi:hypothetical protein
MDLTCGPFQVEKLRDDAGTRSGRHTDESWPQSLTYVGAGDCCIARFRSGQCPLRGKKLTQRHHGAMSALPPKADKEAKARLGHYAAQQEAPLFDHLLGAGQQRWRYGATECSGGRQIHDEVEFRRLLYGYVGRLGSTQDLVHVVCSAPEQVREVCPIGVLVGNLRSEILVVQSTQNRHRQRETYSLDGTRDRRVLVQR